MNARAAAVVTLLVTTALSSGAQAASGEKLAVLVLGSSEKDAELADNLTEILLSRIAKRGGVEIAGKEEFRARLGVDNERGALACLDELSCLSRAAVTLGVRRIVAGTVGTRGKQYLFNLNLNNVETGKVENRVFRLVDGGVEVLIRAVENAADELFRAKVEPGRIQISSAPINARVSIDNAYLGITPLISGTLLPGKHHVRVEADGRFPWLSQVEVLPGQDLGVSLTEVNLPARRAWPTRVAYGGLAGSAVSFAMGGFLGVLSQLNPTGAKRADAQADFDQKQRLSRIANGAFITGAVLAVASVATFILYRHDIFGDTDEAR